MAMALRVLLIFLITAASAAAQDHSPVLAELMPHVNPVSLAELENEGRILHYHPERFIPVLLPRAPLAAAVRRQILAGELTMGIEGLFVIEELPDAYAAVDERERKLVLYNILRSVSTLEGLEYFSASREKMRLLFKESWVIDGPETQNRLPDALVTSIPIREALHIHQRDMSFGESQSEVLFLSMDNAFALSIVNLNTLRYKGLIRVAGPGDMQVHMMILHTAEDLLVYCAMAVRTKRGGLFQERAQNSFTNRIIALEGWYRRRLMEEFRSAP